MATRRNNRIWFAPKGKALFYTLIVAEVLLAAGFAKGVNPAVMICGLAVCGLLTVLIYIFVFRLMDTVDNGINLLKSQDYASRLRKVGQPEADAIVELFNGLMDNLINERQTREEKNLFLQQLIDASAQGIVIMSLDDTIMQTNAAADEMLRSIDIPVLEDGGSATLRAADGMIYRVVRQSFFDRGFRRTFYLIESLTEEVRNIERDTYGKVIRTIAHEVNNTLGGIDSVMQVVKDVSEPDIAEVVESCRERNQKLTDFISAYASLVKIPEPHKVPMDLAHSIEHLKQFISYYTEKAGIHVDYRFEESCTVELDPMLWEQAIINIIKNAVESISETLRTDGIIEISTDSRGRITITDNGKGITAEQLPMLHTPFYTTKPEGQGIGMTLIREILRRHGCKFTLFTEKTTKKTHFSIFFPIES